MTNIWGSDSSVKSGLPDIGRRSSPAVFNDNGTLKLISGEYDGRFFGFYWNGLSWINDSSIVYGIGNTGSHSTPVPTVFNDNGTWKLIIGKENGQFSGYYWNGTIWIADSSIISGLGDIGLISAPEVFVNDGTLKLISGDYYGRFRGYYWDGTIWISDTNIVSGLSDVGDFSILTVFNDSGIWKLISGNYWGRWSGWYHDGTTWISDSSIVSGLSNIANGHSAPEVFINDGKFILITGSFDGSFAGYSKLITNYIISGHVYNNENISIKDAIIDINGTELLTDENGYYEITVEPGTYDMIVSKECYSEDIVIVIVIDSDVVQNFIIDCVLCEECEPCICPPDKLDWWLLILGAGIGYILTKEKDDKNKG